MFYLRRYSSIYNIKVICKCIVSLGTAKMLLNAVKISQFSIYFSPRSYLNSELNTVKQSTQIEQLTVSTI